MNNLEKIQIEADRAAARTALIKYLSHFAIPERGKRVEDIIYELSEAEVINIKWIEIY